jgi:urease accessory protein
MIVVHAAIASADAEKAEIVVRADRHKLAKRLWRGTAEDGTEFGFELAAPLRDGDVVYVTESDRYVIRQDAEPVLEIDLAIPPSAAAGIGWAVGNLHLELMSEPQRLLTPDDTAARQLFDRIKVPYRSTTAVFRPGRFARGNAFAGTPVQDLGASHKH